MVNLRHDLGPEAFAAEFQNEPLKPESEDLPTLTPEVIISKINRIPCGVAPVKAHHVTAFIDVHDAVLFYCVTAWSTDFTGWILAYGTYPEQRSNRYTLRKASPTLADAAPGSGREGAIRAGLEKLSNQLLGREWRREDGTILQVERCLIDAGYIPDTVFDICRHSPRAAILMPSRGVGIGPAGRPMSEYEERQGEKHGWHHIVARSADRAGKYVRHDSHHWKNFIFARLATAVGDAGSLSLYGSSPEEHRLFAEHLCAERPVRTSANGRTVDVWEMRPGQSDNHFLDCMVGTAVAASMLGVALNAGSGFKVPKQTKTVSYLDLYLQQKAREQGNIANLPNEPRSFKRW